MTTTPTIWSPETTVNAGNTSGQQTAGQSITLLNGQILSLWTDFADNIDTAPGADVYGQVFDIAGNASGTPFRVNTFFTANDQMNPALAALADGGYIVVYEHRGTAAGQPASIRFEHYNQFGIQVNSGSIDPGTIGGAEKSAPSVAVLSDGTVAVTYQRLSGGNTDLVTRILNLSDYSLSSRFDAAGNDASDAEKAGDSAALGSNLVTIYERQSGATTGVAFKVIDNAGATVSGEVQLAANGSGGHVSALSANRFVAAWIDGAGGGVRAAVYNAAGTAIVASFKVADASVNPSSVDVTALKGGGFFVVWKDGAAGELRGQRFDGTGAAVGSEVTIATGAAIDNTSLSLAHDGRILVTFNNAAGEVGQVILDPRDDVINGTAGRDALTARLEGATVNGLGGNDTILGLGGDDVLNGGNNRDLIMGGGGNDSISGGFGADTLEGGSGADTIRGGDEDDLIVYGTGGGQAGEIGDGGAGFDTLLINANVNLDAVNFVSIEGMKFSEQTAGPKVATIAAGQLGNGLAQNLLITSAAAKSDQVKILLGSAFALNASQLQFVNWEGQDRVLIRGDGDAETVTGSKVADHMLVRGGDDTVTAGAGRDTVNGGAGNDVISGGIGGDRLNGAGDNDTITGGAGNDVLIGGAGIDALRGGKGNDTYQVTHQGEAAEAKNSGTDTVISKVSYVLGGNIENLKLTGSLNLTGRGNALANAIEGNAGNNLLNGRLGNDTLTGGDGADKFVFDTALNETGNVNTLTDFAPGADKIRLENTIFTGLAEGRLTAAAFTVGTAAADASDRIIYDGASGALYFDADGSGAAAQVKFAQLAPGLALSHLDFVVI
jgi:Ca2+-binding RTX toxin-like protein